MARARQEPEEQGGEAGALEPEAAPAEPVAGEPAAAEPEAAAAAEVAPAEPAAAEPEAVPAPAPKTEKKPAARPKTEKKPAARPKARPAAKGERKPIVRLPKPERARGQVRERRGVVVSSGMDKTIVVRVDTTRPDRTYKKVVRRSRKYHAHDERNAASVGDVVRIVECRPLSKTKSWRLAEILEVAR